MTNALQGPVISARNLGKAYGGRSPSRMFADALLGRPQITGNWVLREASFDIAAGETVGIVGRNGAGKSTLLQMLAGVLKPTEGTVSVRGRVAAMLELGAGFDMEFSGRENVFLVASLLGMTRDEIAARMDDILAFADIGHFVDEPVRTYSTGMFVRLAFAVNANVSPDVLIVDEALAVGDAPFPVKCFRKLREIQERGTTVLFVSHDVQAVRTFCQRAIWIDAGRLRADGAASEITARYVRSVFASEPVLAAPNTGEPSLPAKIDDGKPGLSADLSAIVKDRWGNGAASVTTISLFSDGYVAGNVFERGARLSIRISARANVAQGGEHLGLAFSIKHRKGLDLIIDTSYCHGWRFPDLAAGDTFEASFEFENILAPDDYVLVAVAELRGDDQPVYLDFVEQALAFKVVSTERVFSFVKPAVTLQASPLRHQQDCQ